MLNSLTIFLRFPLPASKMPYFSCILGLALLFSVPAKAGNPPFIVKAVCTGEKGGFDTKTWSSVGLDYQVEATRGAKDTPWNGRLAVRLSFSDSQGKPHRYVLTGEKISVPTEKGTTEERHNGQYIWECGQGETPTPFSLPRVQVE